MFERFVLLVIVVNAVDDELPDEFGDVGNAMLTLFVLLSLENMPDLRERGRDVSEWTVVYFVSFALLAAFILFNLFIGIVMSSMEEARTLEMERAGARGAGRRRARAARHRPDPRAARGPRGPGARARPAACWGVVAKTAGLSSLGGWL